MNQFEILSSTYVTILSPPPQTKQEQELLSEKFLLPMFSLRHKKQDLFVQRRLIAFIQPFEIEEIVHATLR
jgi:hypothetical protein